jgi:hypothetical protein
MCNFFSMTRNRDAIKALFVSSSTTQPISRASNLESVGRKRYSTNIDHGGNKQLSA